MAEEVGGIEYEIGIDLQKTTTEGKKAERVLDGIEKKSKQTDKAIEGLNKSSKKAAEGMKLAKGSAANLGFQLQDIAVQAQMGTSAFTILGQQGSQLASSISPLAGAAIAIGAAVGGVMWTAINNTGDEVEDFTFKVDEMKKALDEVASLTSTQVKVGLLDTEKRMNELSKQAQESADKITKINETLARGRFMSARVDLTEKQIKQLNEEILREQANLDKVNKEYAEASELLVRLTKKQLGVTEQSEEQRKAIESVSAGLQGQIIALEQGEQAAFRYATAQALNLKVGEQIPKNIDDQITSLFKLKEAQEATREKEQRESQAAAREQQVIDKLDQQIAQRKMNKQEYEEFLVMQQLGIENEGMMTDAVAQRLEKLRQLNAEQGTFSENFKAQLDEIALKSDEVGASLGKAFGQTATNAVNGLSDSLANAIVNQESLEDAVRATAKTMLTELISAMIKAGIQMLINQAMGTSAMAATTAAGVASGSALTAAYTPAAVAASIATAGGAAAAGLAGITTAAAGGATAIAATSLAGARYNGGGVQAGKMYRVGEMNKPELLQSGNKQYLIPGESGKVISNKEMTSGGGKINVTVNNYGSPMDIQTTQNGDNVTIEMFPKLFDQRLSNDFANNGVGMRTLKNTTNVTNRAR